MFVYIKVPLQADGATDARRLHEQLEATLVKQQAGSLVGWGTSLTDPPQGGLREAAFHRIDLEVNEGEAGVHLLKGALEALATPLGTEIHLAASGTHLRMGPIGWHDFAP